MKEHDPEIQKILERIRACLALGDSNRNSSEEEVATALRMAKILMAKYNLSMADVADDTEGSNITIEGMTEKSGAPKWEYSLCKVCNVLFDTKSYVQVGNKRFRKKLMFVGYPADIAISIAVYKLLILELRNMGNDWIKDNLSEENTPKMNLSRKHKYLYGVVMTLVRRAREMSPTGEYASSGSMNFTPEEEEQVAGLVLRKNRKIEEWMSERLELTKVGHKFSKKYADAYNSGIKDGDKVNMNFAAVKHSEEPKKEEIIEKKLLTA